MDSFKGGIMLQIKEDTRIDTNHAKAAAMATMTNWARLEITKKNKETKGPNAVNKQPKNKGQSVLATTIVIFLLLRVFFPNNSSVSGSIRNVLNATRSFLEWKVSQ